MQKETYSKKMLLRAFEMAKLAFLSKLEIVCIIELIKMN